MPLTFAHRIYRYSDILISPVLRDITRLSTDQPPDEVQRANRGSLRALFLLSTFVPASRCHWANEAALLGGQGHFFVVACYFFEGGLTRPTFILERPRRAPIKSRIQNTPENGKKSDVRRQKPEARANGETSDVGSQSSVNRDSEKNCDRCANQSKNGPTLSATLWNASGREGAGEPRSITARRGRLTLPRCAKL